MTLASIGFLFLSVEAFHFTPCALSRTLATANERLLILIGEGLLKGTHYALST